MTERSEDTEIIELTLDDIAKDGPAVGRYEGRAVFARHGAPGERVRVRLDPHRAKDRWFSGDVVEVLEASEHRVPHVWPQADVVLHGPDAVPGGAEFGHLDLAYQRDLKARIVAGQLKRMAGIDVSELGFVGVEPAETESSDGLHWRTRAAFGVDADGALAMRARATHRLIATPSFPLAIEEVDALGLGGLDLTGLERVEVAVGSRGEPLVLLVPRSRHEKQERGRRGRGPRKATPPTSAGLAAVERVAAQLAGRAQVASLTQTGGAAADGAGNLTRLHGPGELIQTVDDLDFRVTGEGFWQVHRSAPATLTHAVMHAADAQPGQHWADLYAGAGLFSAPLGRAVGPVGSVVSIEGAPGTHHDARHNLETFQQIEVLQGRVERVLKSAQPDRYDGVVLDPPRAGAGAHAVAAIADARPNKVIYVACDPSALAKDVTKFADSGYELTGLRAFDLYPHTHHVEAVAVLKRVR